MCGDYFNLKAQSPVENYDIHIYFEKGTDSENLAYRLALEIKMLFPHALMSPTGIHEVGIVGPHAAPNFEVDIKPESFGEVVSWLQRNGKGLSVLIHPHTGDVVKDHLESALWLGKPVDFNPAFFEARKKAANANNRQPKP